MKKLIKFDFTLVTTQNQSKNACGELLNPQTFRIQFQSEYKGKYANEMN
jgi:hypothetical protein